MPSIQATPYGFAPLGYANDAIQSLLGYMKDPQRTQQMQMLAGLLESTGVPKTVERAAYNEPLTNFSMANVPLLKPETADAAMNLAPFAGDVARLGARGVAGAAKMAGQEIADVMSGAPARSLLGQITPKPMFAVEQGAPKPTNLLNVPVSGSGFYSELDNAAQGLTRSKGTGQAFLNDLMKKGVKSTEIEDRGLGVIASNPSMTKEEFLAELQKRPAPAIQEKVLTDPTMKDIEGHAHDLAYQDAFDMLRAEGMSRHEATDIAAEMADDNMADYMEQAMREMGEWGQYTAHSNYALEGGNNYREILLKQPEFAKEKKLMELEAMRRRVDPEFHSHRYNELTGQIDALKAEKAAMPETFQGVQAHYGGEKGILASIRAKDRTGPQGEKILNVEEIQSDWHQQGRDKGYRTPEIEARRKELEKMASPYYDGSRAMPPELRNEIESLPPMTAVPSAPFKKNWDEVAMKRALNEAAQGGYDKLALTTGTEQADRYSLAKVLNNIEVPMINSDGSRSVRLDPIEGSPFKLTVSKDGTVKGHGSQSTQFNGKSLESVVGKDMAQKIMSAESPTGFGVDEMEVGGKGMKRFYDEKLVSYLNKYGKKYGVNVGQVEADGKTFHSFDITPEMRADILKGQPLYAGIPSLGLLGSGYEDLMYRPVNEREKTNLLDW